MLLAGVGFLLPYNSFITDVDYLHHKFPGGSRLPQNPGAGPAWEPRLGCELPGAEVAVLCPREEAAPVGGDWVGLP